jgi:hypothetical protein
MSTDTLEQQDTTTITDDGEHDIMSHYARKQDIERSLFEGVDITALCGKTWRPSRDFAKYPVCGTCKDILEGIPE